MSDTQLGCADFDFDGPLGTGGAELVEEGPGEFTVSLGHAPEHPTWANNPQFEITRHASGTELVLNVEFDGGTDYPFDSYFYSYREGDGEWTPIHWEQERNGERNQLRFPEFSADTVTFGHQVPLSYRDLTSFVAEWRRHDAVEVTVLGESLQGRELYRITVGETTAEQTDPDHDVHYVANQHPGEHNAQWRMVGMIEWLLSEGGADARQSSTCHFVPMMSPDAPSHGWYRTNAAGVDMNRSYRPAGADADEQTHEAYVCQRDLEELVAATGLDTIWGMHTWGGRVDPRLYPGPEFDGDSADWTALRDAIEAHDTDGLVKPMQLRDVPEDAKTTHWGRGANLQFGTTAVLCEGAGSIETEAENKQSGEVLLRGLLDCYAGL